jgi:class 3 adenylate cyclase
MPPVRRLTAILAADVAGYSRLMGADEEGTHERLKSHLSELVDPKIGEHRGRIVKNTGDGFFAELPSVVDAVRCAMEVQRGMAERNAGIPPDKRIEFRVGINLGDVIAEEHDIFGDGVNIAARLEALADPGGVFVSNTVYDHVRDRLPFVFDDLGEQQVKNIARPVRVYRVQVNDAAPNAPPRTSPAPLPLPDKPSIAVLPFQNMSGDPEQEYFVDGMVEEIITALSRIRWLFVLARNSSFTYKGQPVDVKQVGRELGVRYVLEGSVRKAGNRVRITGQLIDAVSGTHHRAGWKTVHRVTTLRREARIASQRSILRLRLGPRKNSIGAAPRQKRADERSVVRSRRAVAVQRSPARAWAGVLREGVRAVPRGHRFQACRRTLRARQSRPLVRPELVAEVKFLTWTDENLLRQVVYEGLREDKPAAEIRRALPP